jgi:hypothetical protein
MLIKATLIAARNQDGAGIAARLFRGEGLDESVSQKFLLSACACGRWPNFGVVIKCLEISIV